MEYLTFLPLSEVKNYLRIDDNFIEDDPAITRMVISALQFIESRTNHIIKTQEKTYYRGSREFIEVFDYPINYTGDITRLTYENKSIFNTDEITLDIGYQNVNDIPVIFKECALQIIKVWYFEAEKQSNTTLLPENVKQIINSYRRFTVC